MYIEDSGQLFLCLTQLKGGILQLEGYQRLLLPHQRLSKHLEMLQLELWHVVYGQVLNGLYTRPKLVHVHIDHVLENQCLKITVAQLFQSNL